MFTNSADQLVCSAAECQAVILLTSVCGIFLDDFVRFTAYLCCPPGCLLSVHSCLLKLAVQGSRCWKRMSLSSTVSRRSQVGKVLRVSLCYMDLLLPSCCFKQDLLLLFRDKVHRIGRPSAIWDWCSTKKNLWDLFRFCLEEPFLLSGNANQASQTWQICFLQLHFSYCGLICWLCFKGVNCLIRIWRVLWRLQRKLETLGLDLKPNPLKEQACCDWIKSTCWVFFVFYGWDQPVS